jgi:hypothetical protein
MQATVSFPYNIIQPYTKGNSFQDYPLTVNCPITSAQTPTLAVTPGTPPLILLPSLQSGGTNTLSVTVGPTYNSNNGQIQFTVRATPDSQYAGSTDSVILNIQVQVTYEETTSTDGVTPTAAVTMFAGSMTNYPLMLAGSDASNTPFFGHLPSVAGTATYPASLFSATVQLQPTRTRIVGGGSDVVVDVSGSGMPAPTCATVQVKVNVNNSSSPLLPKC